MEQTHILHGRRFVDQVDFSQFSSRDIDTLVKLAGCSFRGRDALHAADVWWNMLQKSQTTIWLGLAGAPVPSGLGKLFAFLVSRRMVDVVVSVGSQVFHDLHWARRQGYYRHDAKEGDFQDMRLRNQACNRYYNVISSDILERKTGYWARETWRRKLKEGGRYTSRKLVAVLAEELSSDPHYIPGSSFVVEAHRAGVPVIAPTLHDSWLGCEAVNLRRGVYDMVENGEIVVKRGIRFPFCYDALGDIEETSDISALSPMLGMIIFAGGMVRNTIQQTVFLYNLINQVVGEKNFAYSLLFTGDSPDLGGLSGSTGDECRAWGKYGENVETARVGGDATMFFPMTVAGVLKSIGQHTGGLVRDCPHFYWQDNSDCFLKEIRYYPG